MTNHCNFCGNPKAENVKLYESPYDKKTHICGICAAKYGLFEVVKDYECISFHDDKGRIRGASILYVEPVDKNP